MRKTILAALTVMTVGGAVVAIAQPGPGTGGNGPGLAGPGVAGPGVAGPGVAGPAGAIEEHGTPRHPPMGWMRRMGGERPFDHRAFGLVYRQADRRLAPDDVRKIAEAFLLWNGNHTWKVTDVVQNGDDAIAFAITTSEGSVIARFSMDPHTARVTRTG